MKIKAAKAWASYCHAHLGQFQPKDASAVDLHWMDERVDQENKNFTTCPGDQTLSFSFFSHLHRPHSRERAGAAVRRNKRNGGATDEATHQRARSTERAAVEPSLGGALISAPRHGALQRRQAATNNRGRCPSQCPSGSDPVVSRCGGDLATRLQARP
jgi:hypothetical protein